jgi:2-polyprenyl-3-methyl-5-hydroxy-6-metoxy-1,4-benzoquinol methylase
MVVNESEKIFLDGVFFEDAFCPLCGISAKQSKMFSAPDRYNNLPGVFSVSRCDECGLVFQSPRPKEECVGLYYPDRAGYYNPIKTENNAIKEWLTNSILRNYFGYRNLGSSNVFLFMLLFPVYFVFFRHQSIPRFIRDGRLLDIGCSSGNKLKWMREIGWCVSGIETNRKAVDAGRRDGLDVAHGSMFDVDFPKESFDVIIMDMVLEHLYDPIQALNLVSKWLKKDGQLIFTIPTFDGVEFKIYKDYAYALQMPTHITFFGRRHIKRALEGTFWNIRCIYQHVDRDFAASAFYRYREKRGFLDGIVSKNKIIRIFLIKPLSFIFSLLSMTSRMTVFAQKR